MNSLRKSVENVASSSVIRSLDGRCLLAGAAMLAICLLWTNVSVAQVNVTTQHNDIGRTGQNLNETILTTSNVNSTNFGKLFSQAVDGQIYAQPLYLSGITIGGTTHNVVFVATQHDSVYAFDADSTSGANSAPLWKASLLTTAYGASAGATSVKTYSGADIAPEIGITSTPVIDASSGTLYVVSATFENNTYPQRLHALDIVTGAEKFGGPITLAASVAGTGNGSSNGILTFDPFAENQRPGLLLLNGIVYIGFAAHEDGGAWHGWILGYNASTLKRTGVFCATPNGTGAGIWMSGSGLAADQLDAVNHPFGRMFIPTGNGDVTVTKPYTNNMDYGDSHLDLDLTNGVPTVTDEFTTNQQASFNSNDADVASGGLMILPTQSTGTHPHIAIHAGKAGTLYVLDRDNLGGYDTAADHVLQEINYAVGGNGVWSSPAYWNGNVYYWGQTDYLKSFSFANGVLSGPVARNSVQMAFPGATPSISANGNTQGIVWTIDTSAYASKAPAILQANDASNVGTQLYSSATNPTRDAAGWAVKFAFPTIVNGKVYVGTGNELDVFGLTNSTPQVSSPVINPGTQAFTGTLTVTIADSTSQSTIYYTTDGSTPSSSSATYTGAIQVTSTETVKAIASATGYLNSAVATATYTLTAPAAATPNFSVAAGTYTTTQSVSISDTTAGASFYYTTNGVTPTTSTGTLYSGPISVSSSETLQAIAVASGYSSSAVASATYTINLAPAATPTFSVAAGTYTTIQSVSISDTTAGATFYYTTNGATPTTSTGILYSGPVSVSSSETLRAIAVASGYSSSAVASATYTINLAPTATPTFSIPAGTYNTAQTVNISDATAGATIYYTTNGNTPTTSTGTLYSGPVSVRSTQTLQAMAIASGYSSSGIASASYTITQSTAAPTFSLAGGTYTSIQTVTISDATAGVTIYYTVNGITPTTASTVYRSPLSVKATMNLQAIAVGPSYIKSTVSSATYTFVAGTPVISLPSGQYTGSQTVTITTPTANGSIFYTTDGSTPSASSNPYSGPITINTSQKLNAVTAVTGWTTSSTASATYTIASQAATPVFSLPGGTYATTQTVSISDSTSNARIYYTINGSTPTTSTGTVYAGPITVKSTETLQAFAVAPGSANSSVASATYTIAPPAAAPTFSIAAGTYNSTQTVSISDATAGATIYYTTNGNTPTTTAGTPYSGPISVATSETLQAIAIANGYSSSSVTSATYTITSSAATPTFSIAAGTYTGTQTVGISDTTAGATIYYTTNGVTPTTSTGIIYSGPISISSSETLQAIAVASGYSTSAVASATYTINQAPAATPTFSIAAGTYTGTQTVGISDATTGATIYYTTNGVTPTTSTGIVYSGAISVSSSQTLQAIAVASGYSSSAVASATYTINQAPATTPTFSIPAGTYSTTQSVSISDATAGATIYYTTNGVTPTTSTGIIYSGAISVSSSETLQAIAVASGYSTSAIASATYTINLAPAATPTFSVAGGTYNTAQTVSISDATPGATIYYTTNGNTPTTSTGTLYSGPISVGTTETLQAIAIANGFSTSPVASANYTITSGANTAPPTFSLPSGTYTGAQVVTISDATPGASIYYSTDGVHGIAYTGPITVSVTEVVQAAAAAPGYGASAISGVSYTIQ